MIYLNNASTTWPKPASVIDAVNSVLVSMPKNYSRTGLSDDKDNILYKCRKNLAKLLGIKDQNKIIFTSGATESLNMVIHGLDLQNSHVIISATEHNSVIRPLKTLESRNLIQLDIAKADKLGYVSPQTIRSLVRDNTKLIVINHASNVTGAIQDIASIAKIAHENNAYILVDSSQSAGAITINTDESKIDFLAFTGHKSLYGIQGTGGIYIKDAQSIRPLKQGGTGIKSNYLYQPEDMPLKFESGTQNMPGIVSLKAGTDFVLQQGLDNIEEKTNNMIKIIYNELINIDGIKIYKDMSKPGKAVLSFNIADESPEEINYILDNSFGIKVRSGLHCAPLIHEYLAAEYGTLRVSPSYFTKEQEIYSFTNAVKKIAKDYV